MSLLSRLFGGGGDSGSDKTVEPIEHDGFLIFAEPAQEVGGYRISARIEKEVGGETKTHRMIRADTISDLEEARNTTLFKAKQLIDQQGEDIFD